MRNLLISTLFAGFSSVSATADVVVIVNPANNAVITQDDVGRLFLGKKSSFADGVSATPYYLAQGHPARDEFDKKALGKSPSQLKAYWSKLIFTGKGTPPDALGSVEDILAKVASDPSAIAYVDASKVTDKVKVAVKY